MLTKERMKLEVWCEALTSGYTMRYRALGGSMSPFIRGGSILTVVPSKRICVGDIILYRYKEEGLIAHRVIGRRKVEGEHYLVAKGDNMTHRDPLVNPSRLLGKVVRVERNAKEIRLDSFIRRILNYTVAIASPLFLPRVTHALRRIRKMTFKRIG